MTNANRHTKTFFNLSEEQIGNSANRGFAQNVKDLHGLVESIRAADGIQIQVSEIRMAVRITGLANKDPFGLVPVAVQTAGTFTSNDSVSYRVIAEMLDQAIDDVFGYQPLSEPKFSRLLVKSDSTSAYQGLEFTLVIPSNILQLLNKESETERLQTAYVGFVGVVHDTDDTLTFHVTTSVKYTERRKKLVIR